MGLQTKNLSERLRLDSNTAFIMFQFWCRFRLVAGADTLQFEKRNLEEFRKLRLLVKQPNVGLQSMSCGLLTGGICVTHWGSSEKFHIFSSVGSSLRKGSRPLPKRMFFTHCVNGPWPPLGFTQSCCGFFDMNIKKCVNVCCDKIQHNSEKICGKNTFNKCVTILALKINFCVNFRL